jgi:hypothetical protein
LQSKTLSFAGFGQEHALVQLVRSPVFLIGIAMCLFAIGCETLPGPQPNLSALPPETPGDQPVQIGDDNGKPIYGLGHIPAVSKVVYTPPAKLHQGRFAFPDYQDSDLAQAVRTALYETYQDRVTFQGRSQLSYGYEVSFRPNRKINRDIEEIVEKIAADRSLTFRGPDGKWRPDYNRTAQEATINLPPALVRSLKEKNAAPRAWLAALVSHVQAIPYGIPPNGFLFPDEVLQFNYGDCDSKSVLTAAIIKKINPDLDFAFVDLPSADHLLLGVALEPHPGDQTVRLKGKTYVLADVSGPALIPLGKVSDKSAAALRDRSSYAILSSGRSTKL